MKKNAIAAVLALMVALSGCTPNMAPLYNETPSGDVQVMAPMPDVTPAPTFTEKEYTVQAEDYVILRTAPSVNSGRIRKLEVGAVVTVKGFEGNYAWVRVHDTQEIGYVLKEYLVEGTHAAAQQLVPDLEKDRFYAAQVKEFLSLRVAPRSDAERVQKLAPGALLRVLDMQQDFARVEEADSGARGYVMADYLVLTDQASDSIPSPQERTGLHAVLCREYIHLRAAPSTQADALQTLGAGTRVHVQAWEGDFAKVEVSGTNLVGWALTKHLTPVSEDTPPPAQDDVYTVLCEEYISLRAWPDVVAKRLAKLPRGTKVAVTGQEGDFAKVTVQGTEQSGYVLSRYLSKQAGEPPLRDGGDSDTYVVWCRDSLTLRAQASTGAPALAKLSPGEQVRINFFDGQFANVTEINSSLTGYVLSGYLIPAVENRYLKALDVVKLTPNYTYEQLKKDLDALDKQYPGQLTLLSAGKSLEGRDILVAVLGNTDAAHHVLIQGGMHGREHMTSLLMMAQLEYSLKFGDAPYADSTVRQWLSDVCLHILPMTNPDGVTISQARQATSVLEGIYAQDRLKGYTDQPIGKYLGGWKANAAGVDINRNFSAGWDRLPSREAPSHSHYKGATPANQPETQVLSQYTKRYDFDATVSYHAYGSCIYWQYGSDAALNDRAKDLGRAVLACTKYPLQDSDGLDAGGYKDWAMDALSIPSITIEIGTRPCPLPPEEFPMIWERNRNVWPAVARWVKGQ